MTSLLFLLGALVIAVLGTAWLVLRAREPKGLDHGIRAFEREMKALDPSARRVDDDTAAGGRGPSRG